MRPPIDSHASSTTPRRLRRATSRIGTISDGCANTWTGKSARVRGVTASSIRSGSTFRLHRSMSTNTGRAPAWTIALAGATKLNGEVITSSPGPTPAPSSARCRPAVPDDTPTAYAAPLRSATARSNCSSLLPRLRRPLRSVSTSAASSRGPTSGAESGMRSFATGSESGSGCIGFGRQRPPLA